MIDLDAIKRALAHGGFTDDNGFTWAFQRTTRTWLADLVTALEAATARVEQLTERLRMVRDTDKKAGAAAERAAIVADLRELHAAGTASHDAFKHLADRYEAGEHIKPKDS